MKKKNIAILFLMLLMSVCFAFVGCKANDKDDSKSKKATFIVNGDNYAVVEIVDGVCEIPKDPSKEGYTFKGWFLDEEGLNVFVNSGLDKDITVYGVFEKKDDIPVQVTYKITFDTLGGSDVKDFEFTDFNVDFDISSQRKGFIFDGWYIDKDYTKPLLLEGKINSGYFKDSKEITVYAKWNEFIPESLTSLYNANMKDQVAKYTSIDLQKINLFENIDYKNYQIESAVKNNVDFASTSGYFIAISLKDKEQNLEFLSEMNKDGEVYVLDDLMGFIYDKNVEPLYKGLVYGYEIVDGVYYSDNKTNIFAANQDAVKLNVSSSVTRIGVYALANSNITSLDIEQGSKLERLDDYCLFKCKLSKIDLPNGLKYIGKGTFTQNDITEIKIPQSVNEIGYYPFNLCASLQSVVVDEANETFVSENNIILNKAKDTIITSATSIDGEIVIPQTIKTIGKYAFVNSSYSSIVLNQGLEVIDEQAFNGMENITTITIPKTVKTINYASFSDCVMLSEVLFEKDSVLTYIGDEVFQSTALTGIVIPKSVEEIGISCFGYIFDYDTGMACLKTVEFEDDSKLKTIGSYAFAFSIIDEIVLPSNIENVGEYIFMEAKSDIEDENYEINVYIKDGAVNDNWNSEWNVPIMFEIVNVYYYSATQPTEAMLDGDGYWYYGDGVITLW